MNPAILGMAVALSSILGIVPYLTVQSIVRLAAGSVGVWLFYVQHQFEGVYWERGDARDYTTAVIQGSLFYQLPRILQWLSGKIGFHHIHHLRIPNYHFEKCHRVHPLFQSVRPVILISSLKSLTFRLWDEQHKKFVGFRHLQGTRRKAAFPIGMGYELDRNATHIRTV